MTDLAFGKTAKRNIELELHTSAAIPKVLRATFSIERLNLDLVIG